MSNITDNARYEFEEAAHTNTTFVVFVSMAVVIFFENLTVCFLFVRTTKLRTTMNIFVVSLAVSDLLVGALFVPVYLGTSVGDDVSFLLVTFLLFSSLFNLCGVTYDRYTAILQPLSYHRVFTHRRITTILLCIWLTPVIIITLPFSWNYQPASIATTASRIYLGVLVFIVFVCCLLVSIVYYQIFNAIRAQMKMTAHVQAFLHSDHSPSASIPRVNETPREQYQPLNFAEVVSPPSRPESPRILRAGRGRVREEECKSDRGNGARGVVNRLRKLQLKRHSEKLLNDVRAAKLFAFIILVFIICWLPLIVANFMRAIDRLVLVPDFVFDISVYAFVANALVNPLFYTFYKSDYRRAFLKFFCVKQRCSWLVPSTEVQMNSEGLNLTQTSRV